MQHLEYILCPVDFSTISEHALDTAVRLAQNLSLPIRLLHVLPPLPFQLTDPEVMISLSPAEFPSESVRLEVSQEKLEALAKRLSERGVKVELEVVSGAGGHSVADRLQSSPGALAVMGTHGYSSVQRFLLGSTTVESLRKATCPVVTVREPHPDARIERIGVAVDFSASCQPAVALASWLASRMGAEVHLIHITAPLELLAMGEGTVPAWFEEASRHHREQAEQELKELGKRLRDVKVHIHVGFGASEWRELAAYAGQAKLGLLVMGTHGRTGLKRLFLGSVTERTLQVAPCPVISVRLPEHIAEDLHWKDVRDTLNPHYPHGSA